MTQTRPFSAFPFGLRTCGGRRREGEFWVLVLISVSVSSDQKRMQLLQKLISASVQSTPDPLHMHSNMAGFCLCQNTCIQTKVQEIQLIKRMALLHGQIKRVTREKIKRWRRGRKDGASKSESERKACVLMRDGHRRRRKHPQPKGVCASLRRDVKAEG